mgnify:CR=1 FL=1
MPTQAYSFGDRVEVRGIRENMLVHNALATTILEIGPGQALHQYPRHAMIAPTPLSLPQHTISKETFTKKFHVHIIMVPFSIDDNWKLAAQLLADAESEEVTLYIAEAPIYL